MREFGATCIVGFADYIKRLSEVAREEGFEPGRDIPIRLICAHLGSESQASLSAAWGGAAVYDWYGVGDTGTIAAEMPDRTGMHVWEDAHALEIADPDTGLPVAPGHLGDMVCTCLFKDDIFPIIRFNTHDVTEEVLGDSPLGLPFRRIKGFLGRSDNMVKLRGINVYPLALSGILNDLPAFAGEYVCRATRDATGRDDMTVLIETRGTDDTRTPELSRAFAELLTRRVGVEMRVELTGQGGTAQLTQLESRQKPIRLIDERPKPAS